MEGESRRVRGKCNYRQKAQADAMLLAFKMQEDDLGPRNVGGLERAGKRILL